MGRLESAATGKDVVCSFYFPNARAYHLMEGLIPLVRIRPIVGRLFLFDLIFQVSRVTLLRGSACFPLVFSSSIAMFTPLSPKAHLGCQTMVNTMRHDI